MAKDFEKFPFKKETFADFSPQKGKIFSNTLIDATKIGFKNK